MDERLHIAISNIWNELAELFGNDWPMRERELWILLGKLESDDVEAAEKIVNLFEAYPKASQRLESATKDLKIFGAKSVGLPAASAVKQRFVVIPVLYGTDREERGAGYGDVPNSGKLELGIVRISIPEDHRMGELERPPWWKFDFGWKPDEHVMVLSIESLDETHFVSEANAISGQASRKEALIFVHGFNVNFEDAARRAAQLTYDLRFEGVSMMYSWPSKGKLNKKSYHIDEDKIISTKPHLARFLELTIHNLGVGKVHIIAHSMGNRAIVEILRELNGKASANTAILSQIVFAAPDINAKTFIDLAEQFHGKAERFTLYASSKDRALSFSKKIHESWRAGDSGTQLVVKNGVDTIDVTAVDTSFLGHSFYGDNSSIISDLDILIRHGHPPFERPRLEAKGKPAKRYWIFRP